MTGHGTRNNFGMQLNTNSASSSSTNIDPIEDLNRTLYDIGAQDLLDVWEAMEAQVRKNTNMIPIFFSAKKGEKYFAVQFDTFFYSRKPGNFSLKKIVEK